MPISAVSEIPQISAKTSSGNSQAIQLCCGNEEKKKKDGLKEGERQFKGILILDQAG